MTIVTGTNYGFIITRRRQDDRYRYVMIMILAILQ